MTITVIVGPPASGKTTYARKHHKSGQVLVDYDAIAEALGGTKPWQPEPAVEKVTQSARRAVIRYLLRNADTIDAQIIHANPPAEAVEQYLEAGAKFHLIDPGQDEALRRAREDDRPAHFEQVIRAWYNNPPELPETDDQKGRPVMFTKATAAHIKAGPDDGLDEGTFTAYASVFGNVDAYGDVVQPGAFADTLAEWKSSGNTIPLLYGHNLGDPDYNIGAVTKAEEDDHGLKVTAQLDLEHGKGAQVYRLLKGKRISQMSFAYDVLEGGPAKREIDGEPTAIYELQKMRLHEVSVVPIGANDQTEILAVKAAQQLARRTDGRAPDPDLVEAMKSARDALDQAIKSSDPEPASTDGPPNPESTAKDTGQKALSLIHI